MNEPEKATTIQEESTAKAEDQAPSGNRMHPYERTTITHKQLTVFLTVLLVVAFALFLYGMIKGSA